MFIPNNILRLRFAFLIAAIGVLAPPSQGQDALDKIDFGVGGYVDAGRFQLSKPASVREGEFLTRSGARWNVLGRINDNVDAMVNIHWLWWRNQHTDLGLFHIAGNKFASDLEAAVRLKATENQSIKAGLFEHKYNPDSKNLGEYLLRSEAQPLFLETGQGHDLMRISHARVAGVLYDWNPWLLQNSALVYLEQTNMPVGDLSAAVFSGINHEMFEVQTGLAYRRFVKWGKNPNEDLDSAVKAQNEDLGIDRTSFTWMLRGNVKILNDFKLYSEIAVLGFRSDSVYYKNLSERIPVMFGVDIPTFGLLQRLAFELEYFASPFRDRKYSLADGGGGKYSGRPSLIDDEYLNPPDYERDDWKWSLYVTRNLNQWISVHARLANDHMRLLAWNRDYENDNRPVTYTPKDWYYLFRVEFHN